MSSTNASKQPASSTTDDARSLAVTVMLNLERPFMDTHRPGHLLVKMPGLFCFPA